MSKHTPGPWTVEDRNMDALGYYDALLVVAPQADHRHALVAYVIDSKDADEQDKANACLMATAPDLLAALINLTKRAELVGIIPWMESPLRDEDRLLLAQARAVIARAKGEEVHDGSD